MGIINVSPEAFSGDGLSDVGGAARLAQRFVNDGADILDVGGQSTRPRYSAAVEAGVGASGRARGYDEIGVEEEIRRVIPVIRAINDLTDAPISVDTYKASVAEAAAEAGAALINDVWGLKRDVGVARVAAKRGLPLILMHNQEDTRYSDLIQDIVASLRDSVTEAVRAGVAEERIIVDPGFGFGKTVSHNLEVLRRLADIRSALGRPLNLGTSRKSTIGRVLDLPVDQRVEGDAGAVAIGITNGADIIRVHDVKEMARVAKMADAITRTASRGEWDE